MTLFEDLVGRVCVITGGRGVLGRAIGAAFQHVGAVVVPTDRPDVGQTFQAGELPLDVASPSSVRDAFDEVVAAHGHIDVLVNCAGFEQSMPVESLDLEDWNRMIAVHLTGTFLCSKEAYKQMKPHRHGKIINITSQLAYKGSPDLAHYTAAKAGVIGFTRAFSRETIDYGVNVNAIAPGPVDSPVLRACGEEFLRKKLAEMPIGRVGTPEEIASTAVLLGSDAGNFYVGQTLSPCGGDVMI